MYRIDSNGERLTAWVHYGDDFPMSFALYENDGTTPIDLTGQVMVLGIETSNGDSVLEIVGVVSDNEVVFNIDYNIYDPTVITEGKKYKFDFWSETLKITHIQKSDLEFKSVAHKTEV